MRRELRLRSLAFQRVYEAGRSVANKELVLYYIETDEDSIKVGFSISKKIGGAVLRNKIKRRLKAILMLKKEEIKSGFHLIFVVRKKAAEVGFWELKESLFSLVQKACLLKEQG